MAKRPRNAKQKAADKKFIEASKKYRFSTTNQPKKRRGPLTAASRLRQILNQEVDLEKNVYMKLVNVEQINKRTGKPSGKLVNVRIPITTRDGLLLKLFDRAFVDNEFKALEMIMHYDSGKPVETTKLVTDEEGESGLQVVVLK